LIYGIRGGGQSQDVGARVVGRLVTATGARGNGNAENYRPHPPPPALHHKVHAIDLTENPFVR
jgi:hypothetical protein